MKAGRGYHRPQRPTVFFGFSHVLDGGWSGDHYCRSWQLLGMSKFGPITNVDQVPAPYGNSRRLITNADVRNDEKRLTVPSSLVVLP